MAYNNYYPDYSFIKKLGDKISKRPPKCITVAPWLVGEPLVLAVAQLVQIGTAGKVDHGGWAAHQHLQVHVYNSMILWGQYSKKVTKKFNRNLEFSPDCHQKEGRGLSQSSRR